MRPGAGGPGNCGDFTSGLATCDTCVRCRAVPRRLRADTTSDCFALLTCKFNCGTAACETVCEQQYPAAWPQPQPSRHVQRRRATTSASSASAARQFRSTPRRGRALGSVGLVRRLRARTGTHKGGQKASRSHRHGCSVLSAACSSVVRHQPKGAFAVSLWADQRISPTCELRQMT